ncbi:hypothetical protein [Collinsella sp. An2]|uniref:hypothetical protein n=1 Tax=Collinsella sp. An2 TaxID=1965585 RepID=UPI000B381D45|nr:hypothetical protein [Collinsella sp. An2]OUP08242.1 hypothetical protein B5F33_07460 [Collinsella sp. An2]
MKRFILAMCAVTLLAFIAFYLVWNHGVDLLLDSPEEISCEWRTHGKETQALSSEGWEPFTMRGVDLAGSVPGAFVSDYAVDEETYTRWFSEIQDMGANTIRVYMLMGDAFYRALSEYNEQADTPLYLLQGVYLDDYAAYSHMDAYDEGYFGSLRDGAKKVIDAIHGRLPLELRQVSGTGSYTVDVSSWVVGYALGVPWDTRAVAYTDSVDAEMAPYTGRYASSTQDSSAFESMLARLVDETVAYETQRYDEQRLIGIVNSPTTDPFEYPDRIAETFNKYASVDIEHLVGTDELHSGIFALYHVYPFEPDYARYLEPGEAPFCADADGNCYRPYLTALVEHHSCPVVIGEYGLSSSRGTGYAEDTTGRDQGGLSEREQAELMVQCYRDIVEAQCAGSFAYEWNDEWGRRTWNTVFATDQLRTPYWSDAQTVDQGYGILAFDPGEELPCCIVDGSDEEWDGIDPIISAHGSELFAQYDERYLYLKISGDDVAEGQRTIIPIDVTSMSGSTTACYLPDTEALSGILTYAELKVDATTLPLVFEQPADFMILFDGNDACLYVQERYDVTRAMMLMTVEGRDPYVSIPAKDSPLFKPVTMARTTLSLLALDQPLPTLDDGTIGLEKMENFQYDLTDAYASTGKLRQGNADPDSPDYDSLADYCYGDGVLEVRIPWQLLNFSDPSTMRVHQDYYEHYGVEDMSIDALSLGISVGGDNALSQDVVEMSELLLDGWDTEVTTHERLKPVFSALQEAWTGDAA